MTRLKLVFKRKKKNKICLGVIYYRWPSGCCVDDRSPPPPHLTSPHHTLPTLYMQRFLISRSIIKEINARESSSRVLIKTNGRRAVYPAPSTIAVDIFRSARVIKKVSYNNVSRRLFSFLRSKRRYLAPIFSAPFFCFRSNRLVSLLPNL